MNPTAPRHKVLVAVDGSEQSLRAIRYAANVFPSHRTHIVLFHVQEQLSQLYADLDAYPHFKRRVTGMKRWATEQKVDIDNTMNSAVAYFRQRGFAPSDVSIRTPAKRLGVAEDILKESYDGYDAVVVGRTGWSRFKDWLFKSTAMKLVAKIKHIPVVVVGGKPDVKHLLVAFDGSHGAMRGVVCVGALLSGSDHHVRLYSMIDGAEKFWEGDDPYFIPCRTDAAVNTARHAIGAGLEEACRRLADEGAPAERISIKIQVVDGDRPSRIVEEAEANQIGSVVVGRRGVVSFIDAYLVGRVSEQVLKRADQLAVWI
ncbi:MAG TPA: universal stress protein, partial [Desulfosarcina sp.]|nr:universal stress protein [Desulfosarcina sp.]